MTFHNDYAFFYSQEKRSTYVMERTALTTRKARTQHSVEPALEATALRPRAYSWGFSARRPSQRSTDCLWFKVSPARMSGLLGHPGDQETALHVPAFPGDYGLPDPEPGPLIHPRTRWRSGGPSPTNTKREATRGSELVKRWTRRQCGE